MKIDLSGIIDDEARDAVDREPSIDLNLIDDAEVAPGGFTSLSIAIMNQFGGAQTQATGDSESEV